MKKKEKNETRDAWIKKSTASIIAAVCLVAGFLLGMFYHAAFGGDNEIRKITVKQPASPTSSKSPVSTVPPGSSQAGVISALEQEVEANPQDADAWARLGHANFDANRYEKAIAAYKKHLELNPGNAGVWTDMGIMYRRSGKPHEAIRCFDKAIEINPRHRQSRFNKGIVLLHDLENPEAAVRVWEELVNIYPDARTQDGMLLKELIEKFRSSSPAKK